MTLVHVSTGTVTKMIPTAYDGSGSRFTHCTAAPRIGKLVFIVSFLNKDFNAAVGRGEEK